MFPLHPLQQYFSIQIFPWRKFLGRPDAPSLAQSGPTYSGLRQSTWGALFPKNWLRDAKMHQTFAHGRVVQLKSWRRKKPSNRLIAAVCRRAAGKIAEQSTIAFVSENGSHELRMVDASQPFIHSCSQTRGKWPDWTIPLYSSGMLCTCMRPKSHFHIIIKSLFKTQIKSKIINPKLHRVPFLVCGPVVQCGQWRVTTTRKKAPFALECIQRRKKRRALDCEDCRCR